MFVGFIYHRLRSMKATAQPKIILKITEIKIISTYQTMINYVIKDNYLLLHSNLFKISFFLVQFVFVLNYILLDFVCVSILLFSLILLVFYIAIEIIIIIKKTLKKNFLIIFYVVLTVCVGSCSCDTTTPSSVIIYQHQKKCDECIIFSLRESCLSNEDK